MFIKIKKENKYNSAKASQHKAFTLVETLVYVSMAIVIISVLSLMFVQIYGLYKEITVGPRTDRSVLLSIDRIVKDVRSGQDITLGESVFGDSDGELSILALEDGSQVNKFYFLENGRIVYQEDGGSENYLSPSDVEITKLQFEYLTTDISESVRIEVDVNIEKGGDVETREYEGFAILRQSYE